MPATQFGEIVVRVPKRGRRDQPAGGACRSSGACGACGRPGWGARGRPRGAVDCSGRGTCACGRSGCSAYGTGGCSACGTGDCAGRGTGGCSACDTCGPDRGAAAATHERAARGDPPGLPSRFPCALPGRAAGRRAGAAVPARSCARAFRRLPAGPGCRRWRSCRDRGSTRGIPAAGRRRAADRIGPAAAAPVAARNPQYLQGRSAAVLRSDPGRQRQTRRLPRRQPGFDLPRLPTGAAVGEPLRADRLLP
jgi:hypothetical protein